MGIVNVTPDSFSDGGAHIDPAAAVAAGLRMAEEGADILDIGGESTRPGRTENVDAAEEIRRIVPVVRELRRRLPHVALSIDTYRAETASAGLDEGADIINDVFALRRSPEIAALAARHGAGLILMHMQGTPETMQQAPQYGDVVVEVKDFLRERMDTAIAAGVPEKCIAVDPGIGFGKTADHNLQLLAGLEYLGLLQRPICVGVSRKGFLGKLAGNAPVNDREEATIAASCAAMLHGASIIRVHNVRAGWRAAATIDAIRNFM